MSRASEQQQYIQQFTQAARSTRNIRQNHPTLPPLGSNGLQATDTALPLTSLRCMNQTNQVIPACATNITLEKINPLWNCGASTAGKTR